MTYPTITQKAWSDRIDRWNAKTGRNYEERRKAADKCRAKGHDVRVSPVGHWCYRCCSYFRGKGE